MTNGTQDIWGIVLAGGEGARLKEFVRECLGSEAPKQFCAFLGQRTMLEHAVHRVAMLIPRTRVVVVATAHHRRYVEECLGPASPELVLFQPDQRDTAPGILLPLAHVLHQNPQAIVAVLPSDHFIQPGWRFMQAIAEAAQLFTLSASQRVVLLAVEPTDPEPEYGWLNPGATLRGAGAGTIRDVTQFMEKPTRDQAGRLMQEGWLWNTMVVVARAESLFELIMEATPHLAGYFSKVRLAIGTHWEQQVVEEVYQAMPPTNFSTVVLARYPERLAVQPVQHVLWSDWGRGARIVDTLTRLGVPVPSRTAAGSASGMRAATAAH
jgi:mannose-1-phosphate guanylyltransferase